MPPKHPCAPHGYRPFPILKRDKLPISCNLQVGKGTAYTPTAEDVGSCLKCEVAAVDLQQNRETGSSSSPLTARVRPVPLCPQRTLVPIPPPRGSNPAGKFTALTYNLLADLYASVRSTTASAASYPFILDSADLA